MKKITLLLLLFLGMFAGYGQAFPENFDAGMPADWVIKSRLNGVEVVQPQHWQLNTATYPAYSAPNAAFINNEQIGQGNTEEDFLITSSQLIPTNGQLRFWTRQTSNSDENTLYEIRVSTTSQTDLTTFTTIKTWTEAELTNLDNDVTIYEEKSLDFDDYVGDNVYIAFVRVYTQPLPQRSGDRWLVDDIRMVEKCGKPTDLDVVTTTIGSTSATIQFKNNAVGTTNFEIEFVFDTNDPTGVGTPFTGTGTNISYTGTNLNPGQCYKYYVRAICEGNNPSEWAGPLQFCTKPLGSVCSDPIVIPLPFQVCDNTINYGDDTDVIQGTLCGAVPPATNYINGNEVYYSFTPATSGTISITMTPQPGSPNSSVFAYASCPVAGTPCISGVANTTTNVRTFNMTVVAGTAYTVVISSSTTQTVAYCLLIQYENCTPKPTNLDAPVAAITTTSATLSWTSAEYSNWQIAIQDKGQLVPDGSGTYIASSATTYTATGLESCHPYQYWVRAECAPGAGIFTAWAGPFLFNTKCCDDADRCNYTFVLSNTANGGWHGARMIVRQNNIDVTVGAPLGSTFTTGQGPVSVVVPLCPTAPFDVFWTVAGTQPQQTVLKIVNALGQTIYTKPAGTGSAGSVVYNSVANTNCTQVVCDIPPTNVTISGINTTGGTINFTAPAQTVFDIYIAEAGGPDPDINTTPTYAGVTSTSFTTTIPLTPDTNYQVCVRSACGTKSVWVCTTFTTLPTCPKPLTPTVIAVLNNGENTAIASWFPGVAGQSVYDLILVPGFPAPTGPPSATGPWDVPGTIFIDDYVDASANPSYTFTNLPAAQIYYFYVRTVCPGPDNSTWTGPFIFNTVTCDAANKCAYKFILTDSGANGWNGGKIQVRQNGIIIQTLSLGSGAGPTTVNVSLCTGVQFDLFWSVAGTAPDEMGVSVQNPFTDIIFTKLPGQGTPLTVVYDATANCTPPTCPKPTALAVTGTEQTTATLSWTPGGTETEWEIYAVPVGQLPPVNGSPVSTTPGPPAYIRSIAVDGIMPYTIAGLQPGTAYIYYVRALCSATDVSTWTILNPKTFITKPINDECAFATNVQVNPVWACDPALNVAGSTLGATASLPISVPPLTGAGCGQSNRDVWFKFTATSVNQVISINDVVGTPAATVLNYSVLTGACDNLTRLYCFAPQAPDFSMESVATGLTVNQVYYIRVYTSTNTPANSATFTICVNTPPPPGPNDECVNAINVPVNETPECILTTPGTITGATGSAQPVGTQPTASPCFGNANDDVWFTFVANSGTEIISLLDVTGTTDNLNFAVYSGNCGALTRLACSAQNSLTAVIKNLVVDNTYYIRVWSNEATGQVAAFNVCVKPVSSCQNAAPFCGSSEDNPYIFNNTVGLPDQSEVACLGSIPNPTFYTLHIDQAGDLAFNIQQYDDFNPDTGAPIGASHDVDFVAWGPFDSVDSETGGTATCSQISFADCPTCPNNTTNPNFYPFGNIVDCSYDASFTESLTINNAVIGQYYVILVTNFSNQPGKIRLVQTNFGQPGSGTTVCCNVALGPDIALCAANVTLNALTGITDLNNVPSTFEWYLNDSTTPIPGETAATYLATVSGTYTVKGTCGLNPVEDTIVVILSPPIETTIPADYVVCDDASNDGIADFDLQTLAPQILGALDPTLYTLTYHLTQAAAETDQPGIPVATPFTSTTQTIYVRVESNALATCYNVVPVNLVVQPLPDPTFSYSAAEYCKNIATNPIPTGVAGTFTAVPADLFFIDAATGEIDLDASPAGTYVITNTIVGTGVCGDVTYVQTVTLTDPAVATFHYEFPEICTDAENPAPILDGTSGVFTATPAGLIIDPATGVIDLNSPIGTYTVYNTIAASGGCSEVVAQTEITITPKPDAEFVFGSAVYCKSDPNPIPSFTTGSAGQFSATPAGLIFVDAATGEINLDDSNPGVYTISNTFAASGGCNDVIETFTVTITAPAVATFNYGTGIYCSDGGTATPTFTGGGTAGVFTVSPAGLAIDANGVITLAGSEGTYTVTNTIAASGGCAGATETATITITAPLTGTVSYAGPFCKTVQGEQAPSNTAQAGGVYSATPSGLTIDAATGAITPGSSTAGIYTVTYDLPAPVGCDAFSASTGVTIFPDFFITSEVGCEGNNYVLHALPASGSFDPLTSTFSWSPSTYTATDSPDAVIADAPGTYTVTVTSADGCSASLDIPAFDISCAIQKGISPNNDGKNDFFDLTVLNVKHLTIFNRYGTEVYQLGNYTNEWKGQSNTGEELPDATYFYVIEKADGRQDTGWVYINR